MDEVTSRKGREPFLCPASLGLTPLERCDQEPQLLWALGVIMITGARRLVWSFGEWVSRTNCSNHYLTGKV